MIINYFRISRCSGKASKEALYWNKKTNKLYLYVRILMKMYTFSLLNHSVFAWAGFAVSVSLYLCVFHKDWLAIFNSTGFIPSGFFRYLHECNEFTKQKKQCSEIKYMIVKIKWIKTINFLHFLLKIYRIHSLFCIKKISKHSVKKLEF